MSYFDYHIGSHLFRPSNITTDTTYKGETSTAVSPLIGTHVNQNFFNLAKAIVDDTERISIIEGYSSAAESSSIGYIHYTGREENEGYFYGGNSFNAIGTGDPLALPHELGGSSQRAFRIAASNAIIYSGPGSVDTTNTNYRTVTFGADGGSFATTAQLLSYMEQKLRYNTKNLQNTFTINGSVQLNTFPNWSTTFGNLTTVPKSFWVYWNEGYTQVLNGLTTTVGTTVYNSNGEIVGKKCTLSADIAQNLTTLADTLRNALNNTIPGSPIPSGGVSVVTNTIVLSNITIDRSSNGIFQLTLVKDVEGDAGSTGILEWLGWLPDVGVVVEAYDYNSVINFYVDNETTFHLGIMGEGPAVTLAIRDSNVDSGGLTGFMNYYGLSTFLGLNFHTLHPLSTYEKTLNFGGDFWARDIYVRNITISGSTALSGISLTGTVTYNNLSGTGLLSTTGGITCSGTLTANGDITSSATQTASLLGTVNLSTGTGNKVTTIGSDKNDTLVVYSTGTFHNPITFNSTLTVGGIVFNTNTITGISAINVTTANITTANIQALNFSGNLGVLGTGRDSGTFNAGVSAPPLFEDGSSTGNKNVMNYDGDFKAVTITTIGNLFVNGTLGANGAFDGSSSEPLINDTGRVNFRGKFYASSLYSTYIKGTTTTLSVDADGQIIRTPSDMRLKTNIRDIPYGLEEVLRFSPKIFSWKDTDRMGKEESLGLIANEVMTFVPEVVNGDENTYYGIDYQKIVPILIKAIQELNNKVVSLSSSSRPFRSMLS